MYNLVASSVTDLAEMEYSINKYFLISVQSPENKNCVFVTSEGALYIYIGSRSSPTEPAMLYRHVSTVAQNVLGRGG